MRDTRCGLRQQPTHHDEEARENIKVRGRWLIQERSRFCFFRVHYSQYHHTSIIHVHIRANVADGEAVGSRQPQPSAIRHRKVSLESLCMAHHHHAPVSFFLFSVCEASVSLL